MHDGQSRNVRLLLDECLPRRLAQELSGHEVVTTVDHGIRYQQNLAGSNLRIIAIRARSNRYEDLAPLAPAIIGQLLEMRPGEFRTLDA